MSATLCCCQKIDSYPQPLSVSIVVPCKNERENIESAILRTPEFCKQIEFIFVEEEVRTAHLRNVCVSLRNTKKKDKSGSTKGFWKR